MNPPSPKRPRHGDIESRQLDDAAIQKAKVESSKARIKAIRQMKQDLLAKKEAIPKELKPESIDNDVEMKKMLVTKTGIYKSVTMEVANSLMENVGDLEGLIQTLQQAKLAVGYDQLSLA